MEQALDRADPASQPTPRLQPSGPKAWRRAGSLGRVARQGRGAGSRGWHQADITAVSEWVAIEVVKHDAAISEPGFGFRTELLCLTAK